MASGSRLPSRRAPLLGLGIGFVACGPCSKRYRCGQSFALRGARSAFSGAASTAHIGGTETQTTGIVALPLVALAAATASAAACGRNHKGKLSQVAVAAVATATGEGPEEAKAARRGNGAPAIVYRVVRRLIWDSSAKDRRRSVVFALLMLVALVATSALEVALSYAQRDFMTALQQRDNSLFFRGLLRAFGLLCLVAPVRSSVELATGGLGITWRDALTTGLLGDYFSRKGLYWLRCNGAAPDADMRIAVEAGHFSDAAVLLVRDVFENSMKLAAFLGVVYRISPPLCGGMMAYALVGTIATVYIFGRRLVRLERSIRKQEATFCGALGRSRDHAEALAFAEGEAAEAEAAAGVFENLRAHQWRRTCLRTGLGGFRDCYSWLASLLPIALVGPLWLSGSIEFGVLTQAAYAFQVSVSALSAVVRKFRSVSSLIAEGGRLESLAEALGEAAATEPLPPVELVQSVGADAGGRVQLEAVTLTLPASGSEASKLLVSELSLTVESGESLLIVGPSGCGKTTLLRAMAGLWVHGSGNIRRPASTIFLSQEPYIPEGSLRRVLTFPAAEGSYSDKAIKEAAKAAHLSGVLGRYNLSDVADWTLVLSRGELQRCTFCRLLLAQPELAVLDEATSSLDGATEASLYAALAARSPRTIVISTSHRPALREWHSRLLRPVGDGKWLVEDLERGGVPEVEAGAPPEPTNV